MFFDMPTRRRVHDLGELSTVTISNRTETIFFGDNGDQVEIWNALSHTHAENLQAWLNAMDRADVIEWIADNNNSNRWD